MNSTISLITPEKVRIPVPNALVKLIAQKQKAGVDYPALERLVMMQMEAPSLQLLTLIYLAVKPEGATDSETAKSRSLEIDITEHGDAQVKVTSLDKRGMLLVRFSLKLQAWTVASEALLAIRATPGTLLLFPSLSAAVTFLAYNNALRGAVVPEEHRHEAS